MPGGKGAAGRALGGGDGFSCSCEGAAPQCADFLTYIVSPGVQKALGAHELRPAGREGHRELGDGPEPEDACWSSAAKSPFIQLYLDIAYSTSVGQALDDAVADQFAGKATPKQVVEAIAEAAKQNVSDEHVPPPTPGRPAARPAAGPSRRVAAASGSSSALLLGPALALYVVFVLVPIVQAVHYSFYDWTGLGPLTDFIGLDNYREAFGDAALPAARCSTT